MCALGQKRTSEYVGIMSALPPKADINGALCDVRHKQTFFFKPGYLAAGQCRTEQGAHIVGELVVCLLMPPELSRDAQLTPPCWQAARKNATLRATWGPISARSDLSFWPNSARMIIGKKTKSTKK